MNDITIEETRKFRLRQLVNELESTKNTFVEYELPFITGNSPTLAQLERAERTLHRMIMTQAAIEELRNLK